MVAAAAAAAFGGFCLTSDVFATGTCINNTSVMMFKKGSFEIGGTIYPVTIKVRGGGRDAAGTRERRVLSCGLP